MSKQMLQSDLDKLKAKLQKLYDTRPQIAEALALARQEGTELSENIAFIQTKEEQAQLEERIVITEAAIRDAVVVAPAGGRGKVQLGSLVTVQLAKKRRQYRIVGGMADLAAGEINSSSPVAQALLGARQGDVVFARTPRGESQIQILGIE